MAKRKVCLAASLRAGANLYDVADDDEFDVAAGIEVAVDAGNRPAPPLFGFVILVVLLCVLAFGLLLTVLVEPERPAADCCGCFSFVL